MRASTPSIPHTRYLGLDLFRGVAALMVMIGHIHERYAGLFNPASAYLAVDLFFLLSGFVIASAYDQRFASGWGTREFLQVRLVRLYPLYFLGFAIGAMRRLIQLRVGVAPVPLPHVATDILFGLFMLPSPTVIGRHIDPLFPLDPPAWSLFFELVVNTAYALAHRRLTPRVLFVVVMISGIALASYTLFIGVDGAGPDWLSLFSGLPRAAFPFFLGVLLYRQRLRLPRLAGLEAVALALLLLVLLTVDPGRAIAFYSLGLVFLVFPAMVVLGSAATLNGLLARVSWQAGAVSYAVYIVHFPVMQFLNASLLRINPDWQKGPSSGILFVSLFIAACILIDRFYDTPVRRRLARRFA